MTAKWVWEQPLKSARSSTNYTGSKIELLVRHIEVFRQQLARESHMAQELELQLVELLSIIKMKNREET